MRKGRLYIFTGNGKGKTTTAIGLALKAAGSGYKIYFAQFAKKGEYSEINAFKRLSDHITVEQFGLPDLINMEPSPKDILAAQDGLRKVSGIMLENGYDMMVLDEITIAIRFGLLAEDDLLELMVNKPQSLDLIITGRYASPAVMEKADIVTEMKSIKHYYNKGVEARIGIEK